MHLQITRAHASPAHRRASRLRTAALAPPLDLPTCRGCDGPHGPTHPPQNHNRQLLANPVPFLWCDALLQLDIYGPLTTSSCSPYGYPPAWLEVRPRRLYFFWDSRTRFADLIVYNLLGVPFILSCSPASSLVRNASPTHGITCSAFCLTWRFEDRETSACCFTRAVGYCEGALNLYNAP